MKRSGISIGFVCVAVFFMVLAAAVPSTPAAFKKVQMGEAPPPFTLRTLDGEKKALDDVRAGKVTVLIFWATWSPRSLEVLADLKKLEEEVGAGKFQVVAANAEHPQITHADEEAIAKAGKSAGAGAVILLDDGLVAFNDYGTMALPSMLVLDSEGKVSFTMAGYPTTMRDDLPRAVKLALGLISGEEEEVKEAYVPKNHALMYFNMGKRLYEKGQEEKAEKQLLISTEKDPEFVRPRLLLGVYYKKMGESAKALEQFGKVKELDPRNNEAGYQTAAITLKEKKYSEAEGLFAELHGEYPEKEEFALGLALASKYQGKKEEFASLKKKAVDLYPAEARYYYELGSAAESAEDLEEAVGFYRQALEKAFAESRSHGR